MLKNRNFKLPTDMMKLALVMIMALLMAGCGGLTRSDAAATTTWWLEPLQGSGVADSLADSNDPTNVLVVVNVVPGLDTANILNLSPNAELSYYTGARWADELPELMTSLVARTLESNGNYQAVSRRNSRNLDRCVLRLDLRAFYAELSGTGTTRDIHIAYAGEYRCKEAPLRFLKFDSRTPVNTDRMGPIVAAYQSGLNASLEQLLAQIQ